MSAINKARDLNKKSKKFRYAAAVAGGAAGETFVADVENIGSLEICLVVVQLKWIEKKVLVEKMLQENY